MDNWTQVVVAAIGVLGAAASGGVLSYFFLKPKEKIEVEAIKKQVEASVAETLLNVANNTVQITAGVTDELEAQFKRMTVEQTEMRAIHRAEREELRKLHHEQVEEERTSAATSAKRAAELAAAVAEANEEVARLRAVIRETQAECDKWRKKYEELAAQKGA